MSTDYDLERERFQHLHVGRVDDEWTGVQLMAVLQRLLTDCMQADLILVGAGGRFLLQTVDLAHTGAYLLGHCYGQQLEEICTISVRFVGVSGWETGWFTPMVPVAIGTAVAGAPVGAMSNIIPENSAQGRIVEVLETASGEYRQDTAQRFAAVLEGAILDGAMRQRMARGGWRHFAVHYRVDRQPHRLAPSSSRTCSDR